MKNDVTSVLIKHINELYQILNRYNISDKLNFVSEAETDLVFQKAILMSVGYIGELSKKLNDDIKNFNPAVNWRRLSTSRNIIFHDYDIVDMEIISSVVFKDIAALRLITEVDYRDINQAVELVRNVFSEFVAPDYSEQGKIAFENYINSLKNEDLKPQNKNMWACYEKGKIVGVIATRNISHIFLMFVDKLHHKKGIAKYMFNFILNEIKKYHGEVTQITVSSSPYAIKAYESLGFVKTGEQQEKDGIIFTSMIYNLI